MEPTKMRQELIDKFKNKQLKIANDYIKHIKSLNMVRLIDEYDRLILGKEPKAKKKIEKSKKPKKKKIEDEDLVGIKERLVFDGLPDDEK